MSRRRVVLACALAVSSPSLAFADEPDPRAREAMVNGQKAMTQRKYAEACSAYEEANRLSADVSAALGLAECSAAQGKTASAWGNYTLAATRAEKLKDPRETVARAKAAELAPQLGRVVVVPPPGARESLAVDIDGRPIPHDKWNTELPVDPGSHSVSAATLVGSTWSSRIDVPAAGGVITVKIPAVIIGNGSGELPTKLETPPPDPHYNPGGAQRVIGLVTGGLGLVGLGLGSYFGLRAASKLNDSNAGHCRIDDHCDKIGVSLRDDFQTAAAASTAAFIAGSVLTAAGVVLYITAPTAPVNANASLARGRAEITLQTTF